MIRVVAGLSLRALTGRRRTLVVALLGALPILVALVVRLSGRTRGLDVVTEAVMDRLVISTLVPLVALVFGTAALGSELDDGTAIYLLAKPIARWQIVVAKTIAAVLLTIAVTVPSALIAGVLIPTTGDGLGIAAGYAVGAAVAATLYTAVFLALSLVTGRALAIGIVYILAWEGVLAGLFEGTRTFSIRQYALGIADTIAGGSGAASGERLAGSSAAILALVVFAAALVIAIRRLRAYQVGEAD
jgi:ABC-2 type transport system permease protein